MKIAAFRLQGVSGLPDTSVELYHPRDPGVARLVTVIGPPSSGKTRLIECLIAAKEWIAPYAMPIPAAPWIAPGSSEAKVTIRWELAPGERTFANIEAGEVTTETVFSHAGPQLTEDPKMVALLRRYEHDGITGKLEYFPGNRSIPSHGPPQGTSAMEQRLLRTTSDVRKYAWVPRAIARFAEDPEASRRFVTLLESLSPAYRFDAMRPLAELSASERDAVLFAATAALINLNHAIVFVDRPELHVDRTRLVPFVAAVGRLSPDLQLFIATAHAGVARELGGLVIDLSEKTRGIAKS